MPITLEQARQKLWLPLNHSEWRDNAEIVERLKRRAGLFKVGIQLNRRYGYSMPVRWLKEAGVRVGVDAKYLDTLDSMLETIVPLCEEDKPEFVIVHARTDEEVLAAIKDATRHTQTKILAVTVLSSETDDGIHRTGSRVLTGLQLGEKAVRAGLDGLIASGGEVIRALCDNPYTQDKPTIAVGVRLRGQETHNHVDPLDPQMAMLYGASACIVARGITEQPIDKQLEFADKYVDAIMQGIVLKAT